MKRTFWMVVGSGVPYFRHPTEGHARAEAERLARLNPNEEFWVVESIAAVKKSDLSWEDCHPDADGIPF